ncbi:MAG TPA: SLBB domain-containing protein [Candidatus Binataceae bacterium]|nr:SLBB domain-containing protein [Candidatus Binataceae bacterium]
MMRTVNIIPSFRPRFASALILALAPLLILMLMGAPRVARAAGLDGGSTLSGSDQSGGGSNSGFGSAPSDSSGCFKLDDPNADSKAAAGIPPCAPAPGASAETLDGGSAPLGAASPSALPGFGNSVNKQSVAEMMQKLGISSDEVGALKSRMSTGGLSSDDIQELCVHFASKQLGPGDVPGILSALGLDFTDAQVEQLKSCAQLALPSAAPPPAASASGNQVSSIEQTFRGLDSGATPRAPTARNLTQFGYSLFSAQMGGTKGSDIPLGSNYIMGPGDEMRVLIWGRINNTLTLTVGRDGAILVPQIGPLQIAGLSFDQAKKLIEDRAGQITGVKVDVTMGRLRSIQVFVVGEVAKPGAYSVSALSHVANALDAAGGITKIGSLRRIELRRGNQLATVIDLYGLLLNGRIPYDDQLQPGDVIFVPVIGPVAGVAGDVKRPAIYELPGQSDSIENLLKLAGGISAFGYSQRVQLERVENHAQRIALDVDLGAIRSARFEVHDGDLIKVYPVLPAEHGIVVVRGNVNRPGKYEWHAGMRVSDLIASAEGVAPHTFFKYALVRRKEGKTRTVRLVPVDLGGAITGPAAGTNDIALQQEDDLTVYSESQMKYLPTVEVMGEVRNPGYYMLSQGMHVSDLLYLAGGLKDDAYRKRAELARTQVINGAHTSHSFIDVDLRSALSGTDEHNPVLEANDQLFVRKATDWHMPWVVYVRGRIARPGPYTVHEGERVASVLERAGGLMPDAYLPAAILIRQSVKQLQQARLDQARGRLREAIARAQLTPSVASVAASASPTSQPSDQSAGLTMLQQVLSESEGQQAQGRLVIHLRPLDELASSPDNIVMIDQDVLTIPRRPSDVNVLGEVYSPNAVVWRPGLSVRDCLNMAGGPTEGADPSHMMVIKADGSVWTDEGIKQSARSTMFPLLPVISGGLMTSKVEPGDTIYVPEQLIYTSKLQYAATITGIIANSLTGLAIVGIMGATL